jgi:hypothetical protein
MPLPGHGLVKQKKIPEKHLILGLSYHQWGARQADSLEGGPYSFL